MKQKNVHFRKIPDYINQEMSRIQSQYIVVAAIIEATKDDIVKGEYRNVGIKMEKGAIVVPETLFSEDINGIYARRNRNGIVWKLKELPKVTKTIWWESPNFGDPNKGYHSNYRDIEVYQRRFEPPRDWEFSISIISENDTRVRIKAEINSVLNRKEKYFQSDLFFAINLLQEQFRDCHVFDASTKDEDIAKVVIVGWEIFPPGTSDNTISAISRRVRNQNPIRQREIQKRVEALEQLHPKEYILGRGMNSKYFGARFGDNIVAFENIDYGNAMYILFDNWQTISQMSRLDILKRHERDFIRIIHKEGWEKVLMHIIYELTKYNNGN